MDLHVWSAGFEHLRETLCGQSHVTRLSQCKRLYAIEMLQDLSTSRFSISVFCINALHSGRLNETACHRELMAFKDVYCSVTSDSLLPLASCSASHLSSAAFGTLTSLWVTAPSSLYTTRV